ncbi:MAG: hypothetical protein OS112_02000 [Methanoregula sp.]|nr:MAG: hypothetical protein OS112_02000 [Methanoregula sp.]
MGTKEGLSLAGDESIILTLQDVVVNGVRNEVVLTSMRLVLVESEKDHVHHAEISLETIGSAAAGENKFHEPTIALNILLPSGDAQMRELVFFQRPGIQKVGERDQLLSKLKEHIAAVRAQAPKPAETLPHDPGAAAEPGPLPEGVPDITRDQKPVGISLVMERMPKGPEDPLKNSRIVSLLDHVPLRAFPVLLVVIVAVFGGMITFAVILHENPAAFAGHAPVSPAVPQAGAVTSQAAPVPETQPQPVFTVTPAPTPPPAIAIPQSGIWVRVQSNATFVGAVGARGFLRQVNATGDQFYQIQARDGIVDISLEKQEASGDPLAVAIYKDGSLVRQTSTSVPKATIDIHISV